MRVQGKSGRLASVGVRAAIGLALLGVAGAAQSGDARHQPATPQVVAPAPPAIHQHSFQAATTAPHNVRASNWQPNYGAASAPARFAPPERQFAPASRTVPQQTPRVLTVDAPIGVRQPQLPAFSSQRSQSPEIRTWLVGASDKGSDDRRSTDKGKSDKGGPAPAPAPRRNTQSDTPKSTHVTPPVEKKTITEKATTTEKRTFTPPVDKKTITDKTTVIEKKTFTPPVEKKTIDKRRLTEKKIITPPLLPENRTKLDDVRKRLGDQGGHPTSGNIAAHNAKQLRFSDQLKTGQLDRLTAGETAKKVHLAQQYHMHQQGDVARRMELHQHHDFYRGVVSPAYRQHCVKYVYWGPAFFAGVYWYPQWLPWVQWSWHHHCPAYWDPRPLWCRPVIYDPCPAWVYWSVPAWTPLPEAPSGTWVDLRPVADPAAQADLQLVAVRFVDPGHPEEKLGPRYRVWFRNASDRPIVQPFNVVLFAANDDRLAANLPQAGVRVTAIEAHDVQSVDIRLPVEVYAMNRDAQGKPAPFAMLHVLVDANREVPEVVRTNNGVRLAPAEILPIDPAAFALEPAAARQGEEVVLAGEGFGPEPGQLLLHVNGKELQGEILGWYDLGVRWTLPKLAMAGPTDIEVIVIRGDGAAANPLRLTVNP
jgi:hypothetical protein